MLIIGVKFFKRNNTFLHIPILYMNSIENRLQRIQKMSEIGHMKLPKDMRDNMYEKVVKGKRRNGTVNLQSIGKTGHAVALKAFFNNNLSRGSSAVAIESISETNKTTIVGEMVSIFSPDMDIPSSDDKVSRKHCPGSAPLQDTYNSEIGFYQEDNNHDSRILAAQTFLELQDMTSTEDLTN